MSLSDRLRRIEQQQEEQRITNAGIAQQLTVLIKALADDGGDEQEEPARSLDGELVPGERDQSQSLG